MNMYSSTIASKPELTSASTTESHGTSRTTTSVETLITSTRSSLVNSSSVSLGDTFSPTNTTNRELFTKTGEIEDDESDKQVTSGVKFSLLDENLGLLMYCYFIFARF